MKKMFLISILISLLAILSCTQKYYFDVKDAKKSTLLPIFCIGMQKKCDTDGVVISSIDLTEINEDGSLGFTHWRIRSETNEPIKELATNVIPGGWRQEIEFVPLEYNVVYSLNYTFFFYIDKEGVHEIAVEKIRDAYKKMIRE